MAEPSDDAPKETDSSEGGEPNGAETTSGASETEKQRQVRAPVSSAEKESPEVKAERERAQQESKEKWKGRLEVTAIVAGIIATVVVSYQSCLMRESNSVATASLALAKTQWEAATKAAKDAEASAVESDKRTERAVGAAELLAKESGKSAAAASANFNATFAAQRLDQRAWMDVIVKGPSEFAPDRPFLVVFEMKNLGKSPAKNVRHGYFLRVVTPPLNTDAPPPMVRAGFLPPLGPMSLQVTIPGELLGKTTYDEIVRGEKLVYYYGELTYEDVFGFKHWLKCCYVFNVAERAFHLCGAHNEIDSENR